MTVRSRNAGRWLATAVTCGVMVAGMAATAQAQTLEQALAQAYENNPTLAAQRARLRAVDEQVPQALSRYRPTVSAEAGVTRSATTSQQSGGGRSAELRSAATPKSAELNVTQPLYDPQAAPLVRSAENTVQAQRSQLLATEQQVLLNAASAYLDVVQNQAVVLLSANNEQVLRRQLEAARDRFRVGEYTRTDVSQSESRLAQSVANRISNEGTLQTSRGTYVRYIGTMPGNLKAPKPTFKLPATLDETVELARANNPTILSASFQEAAQRENIDVAYGRMLPTVSLSASAGRTWDLGTSATSGVTTDRQDSASLRAQVRIPLYSAGQAESQVREAKQTANQYRIQIDESRRAVQETAISAWQSLSTARASIESFQAQIKAAQIALEGVRQEAQVGSRTVLDVLNQEQELLNARVSLVRAQRNEMVAAFQLLSAVGQLTAQQLRLPVEYYNYDAHYRAVRDKWFGTGIGE
ncbi:TolC family outer membrane protein [Azospirillum sp.]|uniref:TolC family outer membrane protein n=1 Tax=Azospirillum sp. TaxID=34012 RepID=UPI002D396454|nr:TolC family outer membrane protein [Azospirillum sp.]HYD64310.1 TolC family outer membrane protein [Azospirillum sp.]